MERYHAYLAAAERRSPLTVDTYCFEIRRFLDFAASSSPPVEPCAADPLFLSRYLDDRRSRDGIDTRSAAKAVSALRSFYHFAVAEGARTDNPALILESPGKTRRLPEVHSREQVETLLAAVNTETPAGMRDRALFELIYSAGLRVSEAAGLDVDDIFFTEGVARVYGKGGRERLVVFGEEADCWLKNYLSRARPVLLGKRRGAALFVGRTGKRLSRKGIWKNYAAVASALGMSSRLHILRHSFATDLLAGGADLRSVQELLGHADLATTQIYTHVDDAMLRKNHEAYLPRLDAYREPGKKNPGPKGKKDGRV